MCIWAPSLGDAMSTIDPYMQSASILNWGEGFIDSRFCDTSHLELTCFSADDVYEVD